MTGTLTLDFGTNPDQPFVFQIGTALTTASSSTVSVLNGDANSAIFWEVGTSTTLGTSTTFAGNILADQSITLNSGAEILCGRAFALTAAVTMSANTVSNDCTGGGDFGTGRSDFGSLGFSEPDGGATTPITEPASLLLLTTGLIGLAASLRVNRRGR